MKVAVVMGTRPEVMKNYSVVKALRDHDIDHLVLHTNQHSEHSMHSTMFEQMGYRPDRVLPFPYSLGRAIDWIAELLVTEHVDLVIVNGDTAAALAGATAALYTDVGVAHIEAGLRSFDTEMYEERNRIMVDAIAHYLFAYTRHQSDYLKNAHDLRGRVHLVGNTTVDLINDFAEQIVPTVASGYAYVTLHRKEFTDHPQRMQRVFAALSEVSEDFRSIVFPVHPRTSSAMKAWRSEGLAIDGVSTSAPVDALTSLSLIKHADLVITDSGCVQEEAYLFGVPCVTVRENTERVETLRCGANVVAGFEQSEIVRCVREQRRKRGIQFPSLYGEYGVGSRIVNVIANNFVDFRTY